MSVHESKGFIRMILLATVCLSTLSGAAWARSRRPNILWICTGDTALLMSCYGVTVNQTPHIDRLAQNGVRFAHAFSPHPVSSPARSALITGTYATTLGLHNHPSSRTVENAKYLPDDIQTLPELFRAAGYFAFNAGKDDYNFMYDRKKLYSGREESHFWYTKTGHREDTWRNPERKKKQPFFGQIQLEGGQYVLQGLADSTDVALPEAERIDLNDVEIPPYYPDHPIIRDDWAQHHDQVRLIDKEVGAILKQLEEEGLLDNTVIFFFADHGYGGTRHQQFCYDGGGQIPLLVMWQGNTKQIKPQTVREDLVSLLDVSATSLALAGIKVPSHMDGHNLFARGYKKRPFVITARDRCDFSIDRIRSVRTEEYKYIRNFMTDRPLMQPNAGDTYPVYTIQEELLALGKLNKVQAQWWAEDRPMEELYDLAQDPHELKNLAKSTQHHEVLLKMRRILQNWIDSTGDQGQYPEDLEGLRFMTTRWGSRCVNPEYQRIWDQSMPGTPVVELKKESP